MTFEPGRQPLPRREKLGLLFFGLLIVAFGVITEIRSCFLRMRHTDYGVFARAGWAARTGEDIYRITDNDGLHYIYPAPFAVLMAPLADPPAGFDRTGYLPFSVSAALFYILSVAAAFLAVHLFARAVLPDDVPGTRRWWYARTVPMYVCIGGIGFTLGRGQVTLLVVALLAASFSAAVRSRRYASGMWLGAAAVIKVIPAFLLLFPFMRRDWRSGIGIAAAAVIGLIAVPVALWGVSGTIEKHTFFVENVLLAGATGEGGEQRFSQELTETIATDSQSFQAAIHNLRYLDREKPDRPPHASSGTRLAHWGISASLTALALLVARRRLTPLPADQLLFFGCLCTLMMLTTPVSHMHYYVLILPLACGVWLKGLSLHPGQLGGGKATAIVLTLWGLSTALPLFSGPTFELIRECGFGPAATLGLIGYGLARMGRQSAAAAIEVPQPLRRAA